MLLPPQLSRDEIFASLNRDPRVFLREEEQGGVLLVFEVVSRPGDTIEVCAEGTWHFLAGTENLSYGYSSGISAIIMRDHAPAIERERKRKRERAFVQSFLDRLWPRDEGAAQ